MDNKTGKYLKYAAGEIVLVVIGILIALQINNWNIEKNKRIEEDKILENLHEEFENSIKKLIFLDTIRNSAISSIKAIFSIIETKVIPYSDDQLDSLILKATVPATFDDQMGTLNMLFYSGKMNIISNEEIRNLLIAWPGIVDDVREEEIVLRDLIYNRFQENMNKYLSMSRVFRNFKYTNANTESIPKGAFIPDYDGFFRDSEIENDFAQRMIILLVTDKGSENLLLVARDIVNKIEAELDRS